MSAFQELAMLLDKSIGAVWLGNPNRKNAFPMFKDWDFSEDLARRWILSTQLLVILNVLHWSGKKGESLSLKALLRLFSFKEMKDSRDAAYGLLSLSADVNSKNLRIDYSVTCLDVFQNATEVIINTSGSLDILCEVGECEHQQSLPGSWIPHFAPASDSSTCACRRYPRASMIVTLMSYDRQGKQQYGDVVSPYRASGNTKARIRVEKFNHHLNAFGIKVDTVVRVFIPGGDYRRGNRTIPYSWLSSICSSKGGAEDEKGLSIDRIRLESLWRSLVADQADTFLNRPAPARWGDAFKTFIEEGKDDLVVEPLTFKKQEGSALEEFKAQMRVSMVSNDAVVTTEESRIGIARANTKPGDKIVLFQGCSVPLLLRRVPDVQSEQYRLVGECYIHGIMDGELMNEVQTGKYLFEEITII
jgi:hypothetical protein